MGKSKESADSASVECEHQFRNIVVSIFDLMASIAENCCSAPRAVSVIESPKYLYELIEERSG